MTVPDLDCRGLKCPLPVLRLKRALENAQAGAQMRVVCTDPISVVDVPNFIREEGHALVHQADMNGVYFFTVEKR